jgi:hypothetical protein
VSGVAGTGEWKILPVTPLKGNKATAPAVLAELPRPRFAHFATHGFFADPSFRSAFQLDEKDYQMTWWAGASARRPTARW